MRAKDTRAEFRELGGYVFVPSRMAQELVAAREGLASASDLNAGDTQRAMLRHQHAVDAIANLVWEACKP